MMTDQEMLDGDMLSDAFLAANTTDLMGAFLKDMFTGYQLELCARRLFVAYKLASGASYDFIKERTGISSAEIAVISAKLESPAGGFNRMLPRLFPNEFTSADGGDYALEAFKKALEAGILAE